MKKPTRGLGQFDELFLEKPDATEEKSEQSFQERAIGNVVNPLEQIDSVFRRTGNRLWLGVAGIALLVAALVAWGFVAQRVVNEKVAVVILPESGLYPVATLQTGVVGDVLVSEDQVVSVGDVLTTLQIPNVGELDVTSPIDGTVVAVDTARGRIAGPGNTLFLLAPKGEPTQLIGFVGPSGLSQMQLRQKVTVVIPTVNPQRYGRMKGSVSYIGSTPTTRSRISSILDCLVSLGCWLEFFIYWRHLIGNDSLQT
jgi:multidrug resistance efflux pump